LDGGAEREGIPGVGYGEVVGQRGFARVSGGSQGVVFGPGGYDADGAGAGSVGGGEAEAAALSGGADHGDRLLMVRIGGVRVPVVVLGEDSVGQGRGAADV
jgi:hypothetical protein